MEELNVKDAEQQTENSIPGGAEGRDRAEEKKFTQEEVNDIVEKRLNRERKKLAGVLSVEDPREAELSKRERAVEIKEIKADMKGVLMEYGLPEDALELLDYTDKESCDKSMEVLKKVADAARQAAIDKLLAGGKPLKRAPENTADQTIRGAFGLM